MQLPEPMQYGWQEIVSPSLVLGQHPQLRYFYRLLPLTREMQLMRGVAIMLYKSFLCWKQRPRLLLLFHFGPEYYQEHSMQFTDKLLQRVGICIRPLLPRQAQLRPLAAGLLLGLPWTWLPMSADSVQLPASFLLCATTDSGSRPQRHTHGGHANRPPA